MFIKYNDLNIFLREEGKSVNDAAIFNEIFEEGVYDIYLNNLEEGNIILDIGANIGLFTMKYHHKNISGTWHLFEPYSPNYTILEKNIKGNHLENIHIYKYGITGGNTSSNGLLHISDNNNGGHSVLSINNSKNIEEVLFVGIDKFITDNNIHHIDLAKIDCEGNEFDILFNSHLFLNITKRLIIELHYFENTIVGLPSKEKVVTLLQANNYNISISDANIYVGEGTFYLLHAQKNG